MLFHPHPAAARVLVRTLFLALAIVAAAAPLTGCDGSVDTDDVFPQLDTSGGSGGNVLGSPCNNHVDCQGQAACLGGVCSRECATATDCPSPAYTCWGYRCVLEDPGADVAGGGSDVEQPGDECTTMVDCGGVAACLNGYCRVECYGPSDCPAERPLCQLYECKTAGGGPDVVVTRDTGGGTPDTARPECMFWSDCPQPNGCIDGVCTIQCTEHTHCDGERPVCDHYACVPDDSPECTVASDCPQPNGCIDGECRIECTADSHCPTERPKCDQDNFACVEGEPEPECETRDDCSDGLACVDGVCGYECIEHDECPVDRPVCRDWECIPKAAYGEPCDSEVGGASCVDGWCLYNKNRGEYTCTKDCTSSLDCAPPDFCGGTAATFDLGLQADVCIPGDAGMACDTGCMSGMTFGTGSSCVCTTPCITAGYCPESWGCMADASGHDLCVPEGQACTPSATSDPVCHGLLCYPLTETSGFCTQTCNSTANCPTGWTCHTEVVDGTTVKTCQP